MLCSVVKHLGSDQSTQEVGKGSSPYTSFLLQPLLACVTAEQSTVKAVQKNQAFCLTDQLFDLFLM